MILERVRRALGAISSRRPASEMHAPTFGEEIAAAGQTRDGWIDQRRLSGWSYVDRAASHVDRLAARFDHQITATIAAANRVLCHEFDLLGSGPYRPIDPDATSDGPYSPIDWRLDPNERRRFPAGIAHKDWNLEAMRPGRADIKRPWELARCQHWPTLGQAWRLSAEDRYAREIADELTDFMQANPIGRGIHWTCTMDVAIRAVNWALALDMIRTADALAPTFWSDAYEALFDHGLFIEANLENTDEVTSNHFLSNVVRLFYLSVMFSGLPVADRWRKQSRAWLDQEILVQVLDDGADYESSVPY